MKDTSLPAFPNQFVDTGNGPESAGPYGMAGMSMRDYFAGQALIGILAGKYWETVGIQDPANAAYNLADAMLIERDREPPK